jgi:hypothetical protein
MKSKRRATGLLHPLQWYADAYQIPLITIKKIHCRLNPCALDHPAKLLPILMNQPGPKINLSNMERIVKARFSAGLKT